MPDSSRRRRTFAGSALIMAALVGSAGLAGAGGAARSPAAVIPAAPAPASAEVFVALAPERVLDTRGPANGPIGVPAAGPLRGGQQIDLPLTTSAPNRASAPLPANATAAVINVTIDDDAAAKSFLTVWPAGTTRPFTSANNAEPGLVSPNLTFAKLGPTGGISFYAQQGSINLAVDLVGYTLPLSAVGTGGGVPFLTGTGAPAATIGNDGDVYLDITTGLLWGPKTGGVWPPPLPAPPPSAVSEGINDSAVDLDTGILPAFGAPETVWTVTGLSAGDYLLDAAVTVQPTVLLTVPATIQCWWSTRPSRVFSMSVPAAVSAVLLQLGAGTLSVPGSIAGASTADLVCRAGSTLAIGSGIAVTAVQVNGHHVALAVNT